jgi:hypothetical protein
MSEQEVADRLGVKRARDVRRRYLKPLEEAGVLECIGGWQLTEGWQTAVDAMFVVDEHRERDFYGKNADEHQKEKHQRGREAYRNRERYKPERAPTEDEMDEKREEKRKTRETERVKVAEADRRFRRKVIPPTGSYDRYERMVSQRVAELERDFAEWAS